MPVVVEYALTNVTVGNSPLAWTLKGSSNNVDWITLDTQSYGSSPFAGDKETKVWAFANSTSYRYYMFTFTGWATAVNVSIHEIQLRASIGGADLCPTMTANNAPSPHVVSASAEHSADYAAWKAFNDTDALGTDRWSAGALVTQWIKFDFGAPPSITTLTPDHGAIGATVVIDGAAFGAVQGTSTVKFNGTTANCTAWGDTQITCTVPVGATTGYVHATVGVSTDTDNKTFTVHPGITSLTPDEGEVEDEVTIAGTGFGAAIGGSSVTFNGTTVTVYNSWSDTSISVDVPAGATDGNVVVTAGGYASNGKAFDVLPNDPVISNISPGTGVVGDTITITGLNFGTSQGVSAVKFGAVTASISSWGATEIDCVVPLINNDCNVTVTVGGIVSNGEAFTLEPELISMSPDSGRVGDEITLSGTGFKIATGAVYFGTEEAGIETWSNTTIVCTVPAITSDCNVKVTSNA